MDNVNFNSLLAQMNAAAQMVQNGARQQTAATDTQGPNFADALVSAVKDVNQDQKQTEAMQQAFQAGDPAASVEEVMVQMQKANVSFQMMTQVRNKLVNAYNEVMHMPV